MDELYLVTMEKDLEEDFGGPFPVSFPVVVFSKESDAKKYVEEHDAPYVYQQQFGDFYTNHFEYQKIPFNDFNAKCEEE